MTVKEAAQLLLKKDNILIYPHIRPDGDTLGSAFGLQRGLKSLGKRVYVKPENEILDRYQMLFEPSMLAPEDFAHDFSIAVDCADLSMLGERGRELKAPIDLALDHHKSHNGYSSFLVLDAAASATGEIIFDILNEMEIEITKDIAKDIYVALSTDTGCFRFSNTTAKTHKIAAELMEVYGSFAQIDFIMFQERSIKQLELHKKVLDTLDFYHEGKIAVIKILKSVCDRLRATDDDIDGLSQIPRQIKGVDVGITLKENADGTFRLSVRTSSSADASKICGSFGGGGHLRAAGATIDGPCEKAVEAVVSAAMKEL